MSIRFRREGIDIHELINFKTLSEVPGYSHIAPNEVLEQKCDVLIPAALGGVIDENNVEKIDCEYVIEGANQPTTFEADQELRKSGVVVVPDILANAGGVMGSYFEWTQNIQQFSWPIEKFRKELDARMSKSFADVFKEAKKHSVDLRTVSICFGVKTSFKCVRASWLSSLSDLAVMKLAELANDSLRRFA